MYRLCLLTNRSVLLDNNVFLGAKTELCALAAGMLLLFLLVPVLLAGKVRKLQLRGDRQDEAIEMLNQRPGWTGPLPRWDTGWQTSTAVTGCTTWMSRETGER